MKKVRYPLCAGLVLLLLVVRCLVMPGLQEEVQRTYEVLPMLRTHFGFAVVILIGELCLAYASWNREGEKKQRLLTDVIALAVAGIVLYLVRRPEAMIDFLTIDGMELFFLIELLGAIVIDLTRE